VTAAGKRHSHSFGLEIYNPPRNAHDHDAVQSQLWNAMAGRDAVVRIQNHA
jgi:hypothetical protein